MNEQLLYNWLHDGCHQRVATARGDLGEERPQAACGPEQTHVGPPLLQEQTRNKQEQHNRAMAFADVRVRSRASMWEGAARASGSETKLPRTGGAEIREPARLSHSSGCPAPFLYWLPASLSAQLCSHSAPSPQRLLGTRQRWALPLLPRGPQALSPIRAFRNMVPGQGTFWFSAHGGFLKFGCFGSLSLSGSC